MSIYSDALAACQRCLAHGSQLSGLELRNMIAVIRDAQAAVPNDEIDDTDTAVNDLDDDVDTQFDILDAFDDLDAAADIVAAIATASTAIRASSTAAVAASALAVAAKSTPPELVDSDVADGAGDDD